MKQSFLLGMRRYLMIFVTAWLALSLTSLDRFGYNIVSAVYTGFGLSLFISTVTWAIVRWKTPVGFSFYSKPIGATLIAVGALQFFSTYGRLRGDELESGDAFSAAAISMNGVSFIIGVVILVALSGSGQKSDINASNR